MSDRYKPPVDPLVIGALGGSGTRVVARLVRRAGYFIGTNLNESEDALDFVEFYDRWINRFVRAESSALDSTERGEMEQEFWRCVERHRASLSNAEARWGWKEPRSIYLLRFFNELFPGMRFIHVIRDGRDMAFSSNQNQLRKHGDAVLGDLYDGTAPPIRTALLWSRVNLAAAEYGQTQMAGRYLALRFEDLCTEPARWIRQIYDFVGVSYGVDLAEAVEEIARPATIGRWRECTDTKLVEGVQASAGEALQRFGYLPGPKRPITSGSS